MTKFQLKQFKVPEKAIQTACLDYLKAKNIFCWREHSGGIPVNGGEFYVQPSLKGKSDILGILKDGRFLAIEVKAKDGHVSDDQNYFIEMINKNGGLGFIAYDVQDIIDHNI